MDPGVRDRGVSPPHERQTHRGGRDPAPAAARERVRAQDQGDHLQDPLHRLQGGGEQQGAARQGTGADKERERKGHRLLIVWPINCLLVQ